ncbi:hypothetical protein G4X40_05850 [Rhodococcus sp. D2-41]|uniref:hypothetical protein n=1 Tax=Speluncibacter jeojiensis TaxID=2710754 RepID=UPI00240F3A23|nr:hypothetical protein [Rhodococcus sp. D2-41]MDG3009667.1 hypothetical protein [Rhodococcus sp. D2-41]
MIDSRRGAVAAVIAAASLTLAGCGPSGGHAAPAGSSIPVTQQLSTAAVSVGGALAVGPGPQTAYTVAAQPAAGSCHYRHTVDGQPLPDPGCTPGATNPRVTSGDLASTICRSGYTSSIRPPASITGREKSADARSYGYTASLHDAEYDHLISLELGGDPNDPRNLWVEPPSPGHQPGAGVNNPKDKVENTLHSLVCSGQVPLAAAQSAIATDWTTALHTVGH